MLNDELFEFISKRGHLIWYVKDYRTLSEESVVEAVLNLGNWEDLQELLNILGIEKTATLFYKQLRTGRQRGNYYPDVINYFTLYFRKYAPHAQ